MLMTSVSGSSWDWLGDEKAYRHHSYWLHTTNGYRVRPGAGNQVLHRDEVANCVQRLGPQSEQVMISSFIAGTDVSARNGGTHVIPGSHLWPQVSLSSSKEETRYLGFRFDIVENRTVLLRKQRRCL